MKDAELKRIEKVNLATANQWNPEQIAIIKATVAKNTTDTELAYFLNLSASLELNPFNKEIWCYKDSKQNLMTFAGRDGFLKIAQSNRFQSVRGARGRVRSKKESCIVHAGSPHGERLISPKCLAMFLEMG